MWNKRNKKARLIDNRPGYQPPDVRTAHSFLPQGCL